MERLDKVLCETGVGTRSEVKKLIKSRRIRVNGEVILKPEFKLDPSMDEIDKDGQKIFYAKEEYYMLNKPAGVISASRDPKAVTVVDLIDERIRKDLFPVGRLDKDTVGLLIITNDGILSHRLLSPAHHVPKTYLVELDAPVTEADLMILEKGVDIGDEEPTMPCEVDFSDSMIRGTITIKEGRYHQIKRMFEAFGREVVYLKRLSMGPLSLDSSLKEGEYRKLTRDEIDLLKSV
ncbi:MAG: pseudouridine synthase [Clostridiales bacterium]|nr:pseudouridine synthase [Clostridiales bacterium]